MLTLRQEVKRKQNTHPPLPKTHWIVPAATVLLMLAMLPGLFLSSLQLITLAAGMLFVLFLPLWGQEEFDWFSPWNIVIYVSLVSIFFRSIYIVFDLPGRVTVSSYFLLGRSEEFLIFPAFVMLLSFSFLSLGYLIGPNKPAHFTVKIARSDQWRDSYLLLIVLALLIISLISLVTLLGRTGGLETLSAKRGVASAIQEYRIHGYLLLGARLSGIAAYLLLAGMLTKRTIWNWRLLLLGIAVAMALFLEVYMSSRGAAAFLLINMVAIAFYLRNKRLKILSVLITGITILALFQILTILRSSGGNLASLFTTSTSPFRVVDSLIVNRNLIDISKTAHIISAVPEKLPYQWGQTLVTWAFAWIPRSFWASKPIVNTGQILGPTVFGSSTAIGGGGVPPGLIAELFWNFSLPGVLVGSILLGYLLKVIGVTLQAYHLNRNVVLLYVTSFMTIGIGLLGSSVSQVIIGFLTNFVPMYLILHIVTLKTDPRGGS